MKRRRMALSCRKKLAALLRGIISKNNGDFIVWIVFICLKGLCKNKGFCGVIMPSEDTDVLEFD